MISGRRKKRVLFWPLLILGILLVLSSMSCSGKVSYQPPEPEDAPDDIREAVLLGRDIMMSTKEHLPDNVGNDMNCTNCHFNAGLTEGGKEGGISLVGVGATYPQFRPRQNYSVNMVTRVND
jgi:thiosulfate dehydrogenase